MGHSKRYRRCREYLQFVHASRDTVSRNDCPRCHACGIGHHDEKVTATCGSTESYVLRAPQSHSPVLQGRPSRAHTRGRQDESRGGVRALEPLHAGAVVSATQEECGRSPWQGATVRNPILAGGIDAHHQARECCPLGDGHSSTDLATIQQAGGEVCPISSTAGTSGTCGESSCGTS